MRILACPDKFRGSLDAHAAADAIAAGVRRVIPSAIVDACPLADGGEGTLEVLATALGAKLESATVTGPRGGKRTARYAIDGRKKLALIESAEALGLARVADFERDPEKTTSYGLGELIRSALDSGAVKIVVGLGGSSTCDGGAGMAQAIGIALLDAPVPIVGGELERIRSIDFGNLDPRVSHTDIIAACDVANPLFGARGAALVFAPQKGASPARAAALDRGLRHLSELLPSTDPNLEGAGAAGGLGFGLVAFLGARLDSGAEIVLEAVDFASRLERADLVITGEGRLDHQSLGGKLVERVAERARRAAKPLAAIAGAISLSTAELATLGISDAVSLTGGAIDESQAKARAAELVSAAAASIAERYRPGAD